jgi:glycine cleavage system regulatory protein
MRPTSASSLPMNRSLVMTILGNDRPGLVQALSSTVAEHGGNWLESRMARLSGQFAGILRVEVPADSAHLLIAELQELSREGLLVQVVVDDPAKRGPTIQLKLDVVGNDRPGIVKRLAAAVATTGANIEDLTTRLESAPMAGHPLFHATGIVSVPEGTDVTALVVAIENLGDDLSVSVES